MSGLVRIFIGCVVPSILGICLNVLNGKKSFANCIDASEGCDESIRFLCIPVLVPPLLTTITVNHTLGSDKSIRY